VQSSGADDIDIQKHPLAAESLQSAERELVTAEPID